MNNKIILDLCGGTGSWSKPYKEAGYDVRVITHPAHDVFQYSEYKRLTEEERARCAINNRLLPQLPPDYILPSNFKAQQARRSMTDEYFATAFFKANR